MKKLLGIAALSAAIAIANAGIWICQWTDFSMADKCREAVSCEEDVPCTIVTWQEGRCGLGLSPQCYQKDKGIVVVTSVNRYCAAVNSPSGTECKCEGQYLSQSHYYGEAPTCSYYPDPVE